MYQSAKTWYYSNLTGQWTNGPDLLKGRYFHSVGIVTDSVTQIQYIIVTGGVTDDTSAKTVEILEKGGTEWKHGKYL